jgi:hypothetical protein
LNIFEHIFDFFAAGEAIGVRFINYQARVNRYGERDFIIDYFMQSEFGFCPCLAERAL